MSDTPLIRPPQVYCWDPGSQRQWNRISAASLPRVQDCAGPPKAAVLPGWTSTGASLEPEHHSGTTGRAPSPSLDHPHPSQLCHCEPPTSHPYLSMRRQQLPFLAPLLGVPPLPGRREGEEARLVQGGTRSPPPLPCLQRRNRSQQEMRLFIQ